MNNKPAFIALCTLIFGAASVHAESGHVPEDLSVYADDLPTCIAVKGPGDSDLTMHNPEQCNQRLAPCSTFKIPNALIGLEYGLLDGPDHTKNWDGTEHSREDLNQDHDLASAIRHSVVWYFQALAEEIGPESMQAALDAYGYGNRDISGGQDRFWLSSSLQISALEQIAFMQALESGSLPASQENQALVSALMLQDHRLPEGFEGELYGKTGSCVGENNEHGWFAGFYRLHGKTYVFAANIKGAGTWGWNAREIVVKVLGDIHR